MQHSEFINIFSDMMTYYGKKLTEAQTLIWFQKIKFVDTQDARTATDSIISTERYFPTPAAFLKAVDDARTRRAGKQLAEDAKQSRQFFEGSTKHGSQLAKDCMFVIRKAFDRYQSASHVVDGMRALESIYPGIGFKEQASELEKHLQRKESKAAIKEFNTIHG